MVELCSALVAGADSDVGLTPLSRVLSPTAVWSSQLPSPAVSTVGEEPSWV